jgi:hypothetical protein
MVALTIGVPPSAVDHRYEFRVNSIPQMPTEIRLPLQFKVFEISLLLTIVKMISHVINIWCLCSNYTYPTSMKIASLYLP